MTSDAHISPDRWPVVVCGAMFAFFAFGVPWAFCRICHTWTWAHAEVGGLSHGKRRGLQEVRVAGPRPPATDRTRARAARGTARRDGRFARRGGLNGPGRPAERDVTLPEATMRVTAALDGLGMTADLTDLGGGREPTAWSCRLLTKDGVAAQGMGKGRNDEARTGAVFEAVEHYLTGPELFDPSAVELAGCARLTAGPLGREACSLLLARTPDRRLACHRYRPLGAGPSTLVPLFLSAPWYPESGVLRERVSDGYDYGEAMQYSCNSGSAIGVTPAEASLHAVNEAIERDA